MWYPGLNLRTEKGHYVKIDKIQIKSRVTSNLSMVDC